MKIISVFNNKGGVGKSTLTFHLGNALAEMGKKVLLIDLDPQCNLTICSIMEERLHRIWEEEDRYIEDFENSFSPEDEILKSPRSIHFLLKPVEDGQNELEDLPPVLNIGNNIDLIPGRLSLHKFENKIAERWSSIYQGDNLAIRTIMNIRTIAQRYAEENSYDIVIVDTSPSLGVLNKVIISTVDGFFIPAQPDMFSLYGIRNIGNSLASWKKEFDSIFTLISQEKRSKFPKNFVQFLGYTIYNAKKYTRKNPPDNNVNEFDLAQAHFQYVRLIPATILEFISKNHRNNLDDSLISKPIGGKSIIHSHNTFPAMAQALKCPMWDIPEKWNELCEKDPDYISYLQEAGFEYNRGFNNRLKDTKIQYIEFTNSLLERLELL